MIKERFFLERSCRSSRLLTTSASERVSLGVTARHRQIAVRSQTNRTASASPTGRFYAGCVGDDVIN